MEVSMPLVVPDRHPCFPYHFPGDPLVPGALLLQWIMDLANANLGVSILKVKTMKFLAPVRPGDGCQLLFTLREQRIEFTCVRDHEVVCKGSLLVAASELEAR